MVGMYTPTLIKDKGGMVEKWLRKWVFVKFWDCMSTPKLDLILEPKSAFWATQRVGFISQQL